MVMRLKTFVVLFAALLCAGPLFASESGRYAYRAQQQLADGRFAAAYDSYGFALLASRKESDLLSEARILLSMAQIRINSLDLNLADSLLAVIRPAVLDGMTRVAVAEAQMELANAKEEPQKVLQIAASVAKDDFKKASDGLQAAFYAEQAYALAKTNKLDSADKVVDKVRKALSKSDGRYVLAKAKVAEIAKKWSEADSLYAEAEALSIKENRIFRTANILYFRSRVFDKLGKNADAEDARVRSAQAFELMGLPNLKARSEGK